jgi:hypothetical protein
VRKLGAVWWWAVGVAVIVVGHSEFATLAAVGMFIIGFLWLLLA